jgi:hypothetical protein
MRIDLWITRAGRREESRGPAGSVRAIPELSLPTIPHFTSIWWVVESVRQNVLFLLSFRPQGGISNAFAIRADDLMERYSPTGSWDFTTILGFHNNPGITKQSWDYKAILGLQNNPSAVPRDDNIQGTCSRMRRFCCHASHSGKPLRSLWHEIQAVHRRSLGWKPHLRLDGLASSYPKHSLPLLREGLWASYCQAFTGHLRHWADKYGG